MSKDGRAILSRPTKHLFALVVRDGPLCHICGLHCDFRTGYERRWLAATRDHMRPNSLGGPNSITNLRIAHRYCNAKRGTAVVSEEFREYCRTWIMKFVGQPSVDEAREWFEANLAKLVKEGGNHHDRPLVNSGGLNEPKHPLPDL